MIKELEELLPIQYSGTGVMQRLSIHDGLLRRQSLDGDEWYDHVCTVDEYEAIFIAELWLRAKIIGMGYRLVIREAADHSSVEVLHHEHAQDGQRYWRDKCFSERCDSVFLALKKVYDELR